MQDLPKLCVSCKKSTTDPMITCKKCCIALFCSQDCCVKHNEKDHLCREAMAMFNSKGFKPTLDISPTIQAHFNVFRRDYIDQQYGVLCYTEFDISKKNQVEADIEENCPEGYSVILDDPKAKKCYHVFVKSGEFLEEYGKHIGISPNFYTFVKRSCTNGYDYFTPVLKLSVDEEGNLVSFCTSLLVDNLDYANPIFAQLPV